MALKNLRINCSISLTTINKYDLWSQMGFVWKLDGQLLSIWIGFVVLGNFNFDFLSLAKETSLKLQVELGRSWPEGIPPSPKRYKNASRFIKDARDESCFYGSCCPWGGLPMFACCRDEKRNENERMRFIFALTIVWFSLRFSFLRLGSECEGCGW